MERPDGVKYLLVVKRNPEPSGNGITDCTDPLPNDFIPKMIARLLSCRAPAKISLPEALPSLMRTTMGQPTRCVLLAERVIVFCERRRPLVETTVLPCARNSSVMLMATFNSPPGLLRRSRIRLSAPCC